MDRFTEFIKVPISLIEAGDMDKIKKLLSMAEGLMGRWAKHPRLGDVLVIDETAWPGEKVFVSSLNDEMKGGAESVWVPLEELTLPEQTTNPEDVPPGEAWLVELNGKRLHAIKDQDEEWYVPKDSRYWRISSDVTLISPLVPARPIDDANEWVETKEEYEALPEGSVAARRHEAALTKEDRLYRRDGQYFTASYLAGVRRQVLRKGWGE